MSGADAWPKPKRVIRSEFGTSEPPAGSSPNVQHRFKQALLKTQKLYQYRPLSPNCLRLLVLKPKTTAEIHVELKEVSFDDLGTTSRYAALSYHWGPSGQTEPEPIFVNNATTLSAAELGQNDGRLDIADVLALAKRDKFWIRDNLFAALKCLRQETEDLYIWVDAICINQEDQKEKQAQVARMSDIYSKADRVLIWLGPGDARTKNAMEFIDKVVDIDNTQDLINDATDQVGLWRDLYYLLRKGWFSRRWVIQELALAQDAIVMCGNTHVHWFDVADAISIFADNFDDIRSSFKKSGDFDHDFHAIGEINPLPATQLVNVASNVFKRTGLGQDIRREPIHSLEFLVSTLARFGTPDPRDTINCFRNFAKETYGPSSSEPQPPEMDYTSDLFQVYAGFVNWVYRRSRRIDILCRRWAHREKSDAINNPKPVKLPSWIRTIATEDFDDKMVGIRLYGDRFVGSPDHIPYNASCNRLAEIRFAPDSVPSPIGTPNIHPERKNPIDHSARTMRVSVIGDTPTRSLPMSTVVNGDTSAYKSSHQPSRDSGLGFAAIESTKYDPDAPDSPEPRRDTSLWVQGMVIGKVSWRADPIPDGVITENVVDKLRGKVPEDHDGAVSDKFWRVLVAEKGSNGKQPPTTYRRACQWIFDNNPPKYINTKELLTKRLSPMVRDYLNRVQGVVWNRCFIEVQQEDFLQRDDMEAPEPLHGFSSEKTKKDDLLCILFGCSVPVILRPRVDKQVGKYYKFLGEAYVYGVMDGEALYSLRAEEIEQRKQEFRIL